MEQNCVKCGVLKPLSEFEKQPNRPSHRRACKECRYASRDRNKEQARHREYMRKRRASSPEIVRQNWERSVYGASKEDIGITNCMVCGSDERLCIDHDHSTKTIRGILCTKCNSAIGLFRDDPELMIRAVSYLKDGPHFQLPWGKYPG